MTDSSDAECTAELRIEQLCEQYSRHVAALPRTHPVRREHPSNAHRRRLALSYGLVLRALGAWPGPSAVFGASLLEAYLLRQLDPAGEPRLFGAPRRWRIEDVERAPDTGREVQPPEREGMAELVVERWNLEEEPLPLPSDSLKLALCFETIEHLRRDPWYFLDQVRRVLSPDGVLYLSTPNLCSRRSRERLLAGESPMFYPPFGPPPSGALHAHEYAPAELLLLLQSAGFVVRTLSSFNHPSDPPSEHDEKHRSTPFLDSAHRMLLQGVIERSDANERAGTADGEVLEGDYLFVHASPGPTTGARMFPLYELP